MSFVWCVPTTGGSFGHKDGPKIGAISCRQGEEAWKQWKAGQFGNISLSDGVIEYAKTHEEIKGAFLTFQKDADQIYPGWKEKLGYTGESSVQAASFDWAKRASAAAFVGASVAPAKKDNAVARKALDQSSRYADLSLDEDTLIRNGKHVLVAYIMKPKAGYDYLATAAHFAAESSTGTNVNVCTTDDFTKSVDALVYYIDPDNEEMKIAYPTLLFDRNIIDGRGMMCSFLTLAIGNNQGMGDVEYGKIYDFYLPPAFLRLYDGPSVNVEDMWRILGRGTTNGGLVVGTIIKPKLGLQPKPFGEACYSFWQGGDFIKNDEPQGNQVFCQMNECIPEVVKAMRACIKETGSSKLFSANITADDPEEMIARGKYIMSQFGPLSENCAFLVDGYVAGGTAVTCCRRNFPKQFLHYHRAGHGSVTSPQTQRGYTAFVHTKISRVIGASGIHVGTMSFGKMEGDASDKNIAYMLQDDEADGPYYRQEWQGMKETTPIISGGMNALRLPAFFENLGHSNVILTAGGGGQAMQLICKVLSSATPANSQDDMRNKSCSCLSLVSESEVLVFEASLLLLKTIALFRSWNVLEANLFAGPSHPFPCHFCSLFFRFSSRLCLVFLFSIHSSLLSTALLWLFLHVCLYVSGRCLALGICSFEFWNAKRIQKMICVAGSGKHLFFKKWSSQIKIRYRIEMGIDLKVHERSFI